MATFANTQFPTPFGVFDADVDFISDADKVVLFVKRAIGDDVVSVSLSSKAIWALFEQATFEFSRIINEFQIQSNLTEILGMPTGSNLTEKFPKESLAFLQRQAEAYASYAGYSGYTPHFSGSIDLVEHKQDYSLLTDLKDGSGTALFDTQTSGSVGPMRIFEVFHFAPHVNYRFFNTTSAVNYLNNEFSFESFTPETIFYVLPVFEDILRAGQMSVSMRVRRSNYSYRIYGTDIRIYPMPTGQFPRKLWIRVMFRDNILDGAFQDDTINGVSGFSDAPYGFLTYNKINSVGKTWIWQYTLALCKETLGYIRGKYQSLPLPTGDSITLNYSDLLSNGREEKDKLTTQLRETLTSLTDSALIEQSAIKAENINKQLSYVPMPNGKFISMG